MRRVRIKEKQQRGCAYCNQWRGGCPEKKCPYRELDNVQDYGEYLKQARKSGLVRILDALG